MLKNDQICPTTSKNNLWTYLNQWIGIFVILWKSYVILNA